MIVTIGIFDGLHLGHQFLLQKAQSLAKLKGTITLMLTFSYPAEFFSSSTNFEGLITSSQMKKEQALALGIDRVEFLDFLSIRSLSPVVFLNQITDQYLVQGIVVGHDFRFGKNRKGKYSFLKQYAQKKGIVAHQVSPLFKSGYLVSSTLIRRWIIQGEIQKANRFLFRPLQYEAFPTKKSNTSNSYELSWDRKERIAFPPTGIYSISTPQNGWGIWKHEEKKTRYNDTIVFFGSNTVLSQNPISFCVHKKLTHR